MQTMLQEVSRQQGLPGDGRKSYLPALPGVPALSGGLKGFRLGSSAYEQALSLLTLGMIRGPPRSPSASTVVTPKPKPTTHERQWCSTHRKKCCVVHGKHKRGRAIGHR